MSQLAQPNLTLAQGVVPFQGVPVEHYAEMRKELTARQHQVTETMSTLDTHIETNYDDMGIEGMIELKNNEKEKLANIKEDIAGAEFLAGREVRKVADNIINHKGLNDIRRLNAEYNAISIANREAEGWTDEEKELANAYNKGSIKNWKYEDGAVTGNKLANFKLIDASEIREKAADIVDGINVVKQAWTEFGAYDLNMPKLIAMLDDKNISEDVKETIRRTLEDKDNNSEFVREYSGTLEALPAERIASVLHNAFSTDPLFKNYFSQVETISATKYKTEALPRFLDEGDDEYNKRQKDMKEFQFKSQLFRYYGLEEVLVNAGVTLEQYKGITSSELQGEYINKGLEELYKEVGSEDIDVLATAYGSMEATIRQSDLIGDLSVQKAYTKRESLDKLIKRDGNKGANKTEFDKIMEDLKDVRGTVTAIAPSTNLKNDFKLDTTIERELDENRIRIENLTKRIEEGYISDPEYKALEDRFDELKQIIPEERTNAQKLELVKNEQSRRAMEKVVKDELEDLKEVRKRLETQKAMIKVNKGKQVAAAKEYFTKAFQSFQDGKVFDMEKVTEEQYNDFINDLIYTVITTDGDFIAEDDVLPTFTSGVTFAFERLVRRHKLQDALTEHHLRDRYFHHKDRIGDTHEWYYKKMLQFKRAYKKNKNNIISELLPKWKAISITDKKEVLSVTPTLNHITGLIKKGLVRGTIIESPNDGWRAKNKYLNESILNDKFQELIGSSETTITLVDNDAVTDTKALHFMVEAKNNDGSRNMIVEIEAEENELFNTTRTDFMKERDVIKEHGDAALLLAYDVILEAYINNTKPIKMNGEPTTIGAALTHANNNYWTKLELGEGNEIHITKDGNVFTMVGKTSEGDIIKDDKIYSSTNHMRSYIVDVFNKLYSEYGTN